MIRIDCRHGYYILKEHQVGHMSKFAGLYELDIIPKEGYFTFAGLKDAPNYSIKGNEYLGVIASKTFSGNPWDVMRANGIVYDFINKAAVLKSEITQRFELKRARNYYLTNGLIMAGSLTVEGYRVTDYSAGYLLHSGQFKYGGIEHD